MRIGEVESRSGASRHTLRYYERIGLLSSRRGSNNYREYDARVLEELGFIRQARTMGFGLEEIRALLDAQRNQQLDCARGAELIGEKLAELDQRLAELGRLRDALQAERERLLLSAARQAAGAGCQP